jgi:hypothetical protein
MSKSRIAGIAMLFGIELGEVFHIRNAKCVLNNGFKITYVWDVPGMNNPIGGKAE